MDNKEPLLAQCTQMLSDGCNVEAVLRFLKQNGASKVSSIKALADLKAIPLGEAKDIVHFSDTWNDTREHDEKIHDLLLSMAEQEENPE